jgi:hypothetical protein
MRNYALQKGPYNFLNLRISPWEVSFLFLLCFSSSWRPSFFSTPAAQPHPYLHPVLSPSLSSTGRATCRRAGEPVQARGRREHARGGERSGAKALGRCRRAYAARSERARHGSRRVRALAPGERGSWAGAGVGASAAQEWALERRDSGDVGSEAARGGTKRWLATRRAPEELWWKASARDAGTR